MPEAIIEEDHLCPRCELREAFLDSVLFIAERVDEALTTKHNRKHRKSRANRSLRLALAELVSVTDFLFAVDVEEDCVA